MKILIIRHGDPDYAIDSLTEKGRREAELLSERIAPLDVKAYYVSPLGRARDTAAYTLKRQGELRKPLIGCGSTTLISATRKRAKGGLHGTSCPRSGRRFPSTTTRTGGTMFR